MYCLVTLVRMPVLVFSTFGTLLVLGVFSILSSSLLIEKVADPLGIVKRIVENQHGIVMVYHGDDSDVVTGGNVYDGRTNLNPIVNSNGINRILIMSALHEHPQGVLMIGLSIGSWLKIVTSFPDVQHIDVIGINPGYLQAIQDYPRQASYCFPSIVMQLLLDTCRNPLLLLVVFKPYLLGWADNLKWSQIEI